MSRFLGPIHHWLFNKIRMYEDLEKRIILDTYEGLDEGVKEEANELSNRIGAPIPNRPLEELIDTDNIHGWLQEKIIIAETRQAAVITHIINKHGNKSLEVIKKAYAKQGAQCGKAAKEQYDVSSAPQLYKALNNAILDGMPCDNVNNITINEEDRLQWKVINCLHKGYWESVQGDISVLYELRKIWISSFISSANDSFVYDFKIEEVNNKKILVNEIRK